jgi:tryptophan synthase alpha chain
MIRANETLAPRIAAAFSSPRAGRAALIPYVTAGFPDMQTSHAVVEAFVAAGADIVELGVPFSDPIADGPTVQHSAHEALCAGTTPEHVFELAGAHRAETPFVLLTYLNTVLAYGPRRFFARAAETGVEALVIPDLPVDEAREQAGLAAEAGISLVPLAAPTSTDARLRLVGQAATSFIYCVSVAGVTGVRGALSAHLPNLLARLRARTAAPLAVGFGIATAEQAAAVAEQADGLIVGSALIDLIASSDSQEAACAAVTERLTAMSAAIAQGA